jgi:nucleoside-diphosphate-sugar epimerase
VSNFVSQALRDEPLTVYGDGQQTRSFQYVSDLVNGLVTLMEGEHTGPFNIGNPGEFTMLELAKVRPALTPTTRLKSFFLKVELRRAQTTDVEDLVTGSRSHRHCAEVPLARVLPSVLQQVRASFTGFPT